jgi:hypothetical protein
MTKASMTNDQWKRSKAFSLVIRASSFIISISGKPGGLPYECSLSLPRLRWHGVAALAAFDLVVEFRPTLAAAAGHGGVNELGARASLHRRTIRTEVGGKAPKLSEE